VATWEQAPDLSHVSDEVVVHHEQGAPPTLLVQDVQLVQDLGRGLGAGLAPEQLDDVAELAVVGTPSGVLEGHGRVLLPADEVEAWRRREGDVGLGRIQVDALGPAAVKVREEARKRDLRLVEDKVVHPLDALVRRRGIGPATTRFPCFLHRLMTRARESFCTIMDDVNTTSAADTASSQSGSTFMSTSVTS
jgi:hypothetical protein